MAQQERGLKLRCREGHFEMAEFELKRQPDGYWMWVSCDFDGHQGGHWLAPDPAEADNVYVSSSPYSWAGAVEAFKAKDQWEAQQEA
jgi:hypothetical protein